MRMHEAKDMTSSPQGDYCACRDILPDDDIQIEVTGIPDGTSTILVCAKCRREVTTVETEKWLTYNPVVPA